MTNYLSKGDIIEKEGKWIIIDMSERFCLLVQLDITKTKIVKEFLSNVLTDIESGDAKLVGKKTVKKTSFKKVIMGKAGLINERNRKMASDLLNYADNLFWLANKNSRVEFLNQCSQKYDISVLSVRRFVRDYLQNGLSLHEMQCKYFRCGGKGKCKNYKNGKRAGRRGISQVVRDEDVILQFEVMVRRYIRNKSGMTITMLYDDLCEKYYSTKSVVNGEISYNVFASANRPTKKQLYYYLKTHLSEHEKYEAKYGSRQAWNNIRPLHSDTIADLDLKSIGSRFEMDEMETDFYLVSRSNPNEVIGRAILYLIVDVYSKMITGFHVGCDNNSWAGAEIALLNMAESKVDICERAGIYISEEDWPVSGYLPDMIQVDNGAEYLSFDFERFASENGIKIAYTPARMGSFKPNVERKFRQFNLQMKGRLPGEIRKDVYGQPHISEARLNIEDFYKIVLQFILYHNKTPIGKYQCDKSIFDAGIIPTPLNIWNFKMKETNNLRRIPNIEQYRFSLLSDANATITREGIIFNKMIYTCEDLEWLSREMAEASFGPRKKIAIKYDKRNLNIIHIERNGYYITGWLNERKTINEKYFDSIIEQVESINKQLSQRERLSHELGVVQRINLNAKTDEIVKDAKRRHSGKNSKKNIRENRRIEKELLHKEAQIVPEKTCNAKLTHCEQQHCVQERAPSLVYTEHPDFHKLSTAEKIRIMEEIEFEKAVFGYSGEMEES